MDLRDVRVKLTNCLQQQERGFRTAAAATEIEKIKDEIKEGLADNRAGTCTHAFEAIYGLPCWHSLSKRIDNDQTLLPSDIHQQWNLSPEIESAVSEDAEEDSKTGIGEYQKTLEQVETTYQGLNSSEQKEMKAQLMPMATRRSRAPNPPCAIIKQRGRPAGSKQPFKNEASIKRDLSAFEHQTQGKCRCSNCGKIGHNKRSCRIPVTSLESGQA
ncbi:unnamed protein product [Albugo candida]|uniref:CCHC-type domain-containing protein n=1 Tax=Albugo candida TaxID=65357 RepID=A0A024FWR9_9STRA|nr:unnamed protein product [Albugo candida]|eukprot:CCI11623.1 unnamed protein product [Albugo candida]